MENIFICVLSNSFESSNHKSVLGIPCLVIYLKDQITNVSRNPTDDRILDQK